MKTKRLNLKCAKGLNRPLTKVHIYMVDICLKRFSAPHVTRKCKLKQEDIITYLLQWLQSRTQTIPNVGKRMEQQDLSFIADRMQNRMVTLEDTYRVKVEHRLT